MTGIYIFSQSYRRPNVYPKEKTKTLREPVHCTDLANYKTRTS